MRLVPASVIASVPAAVDWIAVSKVVALELAFVGAMVSVLTGHGTPDSVSLCWGLGGTLGLLRIGDIAANAFNVRSYLNAPGAASSGMMPSASNTPLVTIPGNGGDNASPSAT